MQAVRDSSRGGSLLYSSSAALPSTAQGVKLDQAHVVPTPTPRPASDCKPMTRSFRGQLLTPVASDAPTESNEYISQQTSRQEIHSDVEDFGDSLDEDDEEVIELAKLVEKSGQMEKSPPSRARKLNIRDTHEHDDYGGALLSEEERKLLGMSSTPSSREWVLTVNRCHQSTTGHTQTNRACQVPTTYHGPLISLWGVQHQCTPHLLPRRRSSECRVPSCAQQSKLDSGAICTNHQLVARA